LDIWVRNGWPALKLNMPHINCADGAGVVEAVSAGVHNVAPGDRVGINPTIIDEDCIRLTGQEENCLDIHILGETVPGVGAEQMVLPARNLIKLPDHISFAESAAAGLVYITSWHSLIARGGMQAGESVLIVGAGGGVNTASIQIAKLAGAKVYVMGSNADKCTQAKALGADVTINREEEEDWSKALFKLTNKQGVDVVVDNVGQATMFSSIRSVRRGGRILVVGNTSGPMFNMDLRYLFAKQISIIGSSMGTTSDFVKVMNLVFEGKLKPVVSKVLPLTEIQEAHRLLEELDVFGKIVFDV
jgi:NADPH:quinone reductase-like Zn-dependent oxidoreductase